MPLVAVISSPIMPQGDIGNGLGPPRKRRFTATAKRTGLASESASHGEGFAVSQGSLGLKTEIRIEISGLGNGARPT